MALIHWMASSFSPEKLAERAAFSSVVCEDMTGGAMGARGAGPTGGAWVTGGIGSDEASSVEDKGCTSWGFLDRQGQVAEVRMFSTGALSSL